MILEEILIFEKNYITRNPSAFSNGIIIDKALLMRSITYKEALSRLSGEFCPFCQWKKNKEYTTEGMKMIKGKVDLVQLEIWVFIVNGWRWESIVEMDCSCDSFSPRRLGTEDSIRSVRVTSRCLFFLSATPLCCGVYGHVCCDTIPFSY